MFALLSVVRPEQIIVPLVVALIAAVGAIAVGWRRLTVLGAAERDKLDAEKDNIIQTAEDRATARALEALKIALDITERERDRALDAAERRWRELESARGEIAGLRQRLSALEVIVRSHGIDIDHINRHGKQGPPGEKGPTGDQGKPGDTAP